VALKSDRVNHWLPERAARLSSVMIQLGRNKVLYHKWVQIRLGADRLSDFQTLQKGGVLAGLSGDMKPADWSAI